MLFILLLLVRQCIASGNQFLWSNFDGWNTPEQCKTSISTTNGINDPVSQATRSALSETAVPAGYISSLANFVSCHTAVKHARRALKARIPISLVVVSNNTHNTTIALIGACVGAGLIAALAFVAVMRVRRKRALANSQDTLPRPFQLPVPPVPAAGSIIPLLRPSVHSSITMPSPPPRNSLTITLAGQPSSEPRGPAHTYRQLTPSTVPADRPVAQPLPRDLAIRFDDRRVAGQPRAHRRPPPPPPTSNSPHLASTQPSSPSPSEHPSPLLRRELDLVKSAHCIPRSASDLDCSSPRQPAGDRRLTHQARSASDLSDSARGTLHHNGPSRARPHRTQEERSRHSRSSRVVSPLVPQNRNRRAASATAQQREAVSEEIPPPYDRIRGLRRGFRVV